MSFEPIPTEYAGVEFRSKSEAIFARAMDLSESWFALEWEYEPEDIYGELLPGAYQPDFHVSAIDESIPNGPVVDFLVEYKPSNVTQTYSERLTRWMRENEIPVPLVMYCGSPYSKERTAFWVIFPESVEGEYLLWQRFCLKFLLKEVHRHINDAMSFRFDLKDAA